MTEDIRQTETLLPPSTMTLLGSRRFGPFFHTQFLGAFNDNVFKTALMTLITFSATKGSASTNTLNNIAMGLFILPFFLFSAMAGEIADRREKAWLVRRIKFVEIVLMSAAAAAFVLHNIPGLLVLLFLMGAQSTFFGPIKYSIIPQHLPPHEVVSGNALVELGTFLAILLGNFAGVVLINHFHTPLAAGLAVILVALIGWWTSMYIPHAAPPADPSLLRLRPIRHSLETLQHVWQRPPLRVAVLCVSWFWLGGSAYIAQLPVYVRDVLHADSEVFGLFLILFSVGIGAGSMLCARISHGHLRPVLVPAAGVVLGLAGIDLALFTPHATAVRQDLHAFLHITANLHLSLDVFLLGFAGGLYIVPLYTLVQTRAPEDRVARVIAANNIVNALFMVLSAVAGIVLVGILKLTLPQFFLALATANLLMALLLYWRAPEFRDWNPDPAN